MRPLLAPARQPSAHARWAIVAFGSEAALESGSSKALRPLPRGKHASSRATWGSSTKLSFAVNGAAVVTAVEVGAVARFVGFGGIGAAGDPGEGGARHEDGRDDALIRAPP